MPLLQVKSIHLRGLKENVVIGHIIPAGTGMRCYRNYRLFTKDTEDLDTHVTEILEQRRKEEEQKAAMENESMASVEVNTKATVEG